MVIHRLITIATDALTFYFVFIKNWSVLGVNMRERRLIAMVLTFINTCINTFHLRPKKPVKKYMYNAAITYIYTNLLFLLIKGEGFFRKCLLKNVGFYFTCI